MRETAWFCEKCRQGDLTKQGRDVQALAKRRACECQRVATQREQPVQRRVGSWEELRKGAVGWAGPAEAHPLKALGALGECLPEREAIVTLHAGVLDSQAASDSPRVSLWVRGTLVWSPDFLSLTCHI